MVDFRNCVTPSSAPDVVPFPGGLNDCVAGVKWVSENAEALGIDASRMIIAGESGGGNLTLATGMKLLRDGDIGLVQGLYALCPYIAGSWPRDDLPSTIENNGILLDLHNNQGAMGYGIEAFEAEDPLAWPLFASSEDVIGLPTTTISVNECDPPARRGDRLLSTVARLRRLGSVSASDGHDSRHRSLPDGLPGDLAGYGTGPRGDGDRFVARGWLARGTLALGSMIEVWAPRPPVKPGAGKHGASDWEDRPRYGGIVSAVGPLRPFGAPPPTGGRS